MDPVQVAGVEHREKVGRRGDAIKPYAVRKADILRGMKLAANVKDKGIKFKVIAQGGDRVVRQSPFKISFTDEHDTIVTHWAILD